MALVRSCIVLILLFAAGAVDVPAQEVRDARRDMRRTERKERRALAESQRLRRDSLKRAFSATRPQRFGLSVKGLSGRRDSLKSTPGRRHLPAANTGRAVASDPLRAYVVPMDTLVVLRPLSDTAAIADGHVLVGAKSRTRVRAGVKEPDRYYNEYINDSLPDCPACGTMDSAGRIRLHEWYDSVHIVRYHYDRYKDFDRPEVVNRKIESMPPFGIFKDNYFVTGTSFSGGKVTKYNSDAKFQISFSHRLIKGVLPYNTHLFLAYTQKSFWDIYRESKPFKENNYNPALGLSNYITRNKKVIGVLLLQYEHESNGRDSIFSRSWNMLSLTGVALINRNLSIHAKVWIPHALDKTNKDLVKYAGYATVGANYQMCDQRLSFSAFVTKRGGWNLNANFNLEAAFRLTRRSNQFLCIQYYNGYGESMIEYNQFHSYLRIGIVIKSRYFSMY